MDITEEYIIEALENTAKYAYYKSYVEPLELEHDKLLDTLDESRQEINKLRKQIQRLKESKKQPFKEDTAALRREYEKLLKEVSALTQENTELRKENKELKKLKKKIGFNVDDYDRLKKQNLELIRRLKMRRS